MEKYCLRLVVFMALICFYICGIPLAAHADQYGSFTYQTDGPNAVITAFADGESVVVVPSTINSLTVTGIGDSAFLECTTLASITIPDGVTNIGDHAFMWCERLTNVVFPKSLARIGVSAFQECKSLPNITIPSGVTSIGENAFSVCTSLADFSVDSANPSYESTDGVLFNKGQTRLIQFPCKKAGAYTMPNSVTSIGTNAFSWCASLTSIGFSDNLTSIEDFAFHWCSNLTSVVIPNSVTNLGSSAFWGCSGLTNALIGNGVSKLENAVFSSCSLLKNVTLPNTITRIGDSEFLECHSLTGITLPNRVQSIGQFAFRGCYSLTNLVIPNNVTNIGDYAFLWCSSLTSFTIPNGVTKIGDFTFYHCYGLTNVTIPNSVTAIGESAFYECSGLTDVTVPSGVTRIGDSAFYNCSSLKGLYFTGDAPSEVGTNVIYGSNFGIVYYRSGTTGWSFSFAGRPTESWVDLSASNFVWQTNGSNLTITRYTGSDSTAVIPSSINGMPVTQIGAGAFGELANMTAVTIPTSVVSIDREAFSRCTGLTSLTIPNSVTDIGREAFFYCSNLSTVRVSRSVTNIANFAFYFCFNLTNIEVDGANDLFRSIDGVLYDKSGATLVLCPGGKSGSFSIPTTVTSIKNDAFSGCIYLTNITVPTGVTIIEDFAFENCPSLADVYFEGNAPSSFGEYIFEAATSAVVYYKKGTAGWTVTLAGRPTAPWPEVAFQLQPNHLILTWPRGALLETTNLVSGPWITNSAAQSPYRGDLSSPQKFYRLKLN